MDNSIPRVCLLGGFSVATEDGVVEERAWRLRKAKALVKLLALAPERRLHRERLADLLWPDRDAEAAANNLHQALHAARRAIGPDALRLSDGVVALEAEVDVDAFEAAAARARDDARGRRLRAPRSTSTPASCCPRTATSRGPTRAAPRCSSSTAPCASSWPSCYGDDAQAVAALQRALVVDPLAEPAHRALMRVYAASGRRQQALAQYQLLRQQLDAELAAEPDPETRSLYRELLAPEPATDARGNLPHPLTSFVGRERERGEILRLLERVRLLTLIGPGGCGKTRLAIETLAGVEPVPDGIWFVELAGLDRRRRSWPRPRRWPSASPSRRSARRRRRSPRTWRRARRSSCSTTASTSSTPARAWPRTSCAPGPACASWPRAASRCTARARCAWRVPSLAEASRLFVERAAADPRLQPHRAGRGDDRGDLPAPGRHAAGHRAGRGARGRAARSIRSRRAWATASTCSPPAAAPRARASRRCAPPSSGATTCSPARSACSSGAWPIFAGGFTLEAAEDVCAGGAIARRQIVDLLARLVDKSLVSGTGRRFRLLDTIRQYAAERLDAAAEHDTVAVRHLDWCLALAERARPAVRRPAPLAAHAGDRARQPARGPDLRPAPRSAGRPAPGHVAVALLAGPRLLRRGRPLAGGDAGRRARAHRAARRGPAGQRRALAAQRRLRRSYLQRVQAAVADYRELGDEHATAAALYQHAMLEQSVSNTARADALFADAVALARRLGDRRLLAAATHASAMTPWYRSDREQARAVDLRGAGASSRRLPDDDTPFFDVVTFGLCLLHDGPAGQSAPAPRGDDLPLPSLRPRPGRRLRAQQPGLDRARDGRRRAATAALDEALERFRAVEDRAGEALTLNHMGSLARTQGDLDAGRAHLRAALELRRELGEKRAILDEHDVRWACSR